MTAQPDEDLKHEDTVHSVLTSQTIKEHDKIDDKSVIKNKFVKKESIPERPKTPIMTHAPRKTVIDKKELNKSALTIDTKEKTDKPEAKTSKAADKKKNTAIEKAPMNGRRATIATEVKENRKASVVAKDYATSPRKTSQPPTPNNKIAIKSDKTDTLRKSSVITKKPAININGTSPIKKGNAVNANANSSASPNKKNSAVNNILTNKDISTINDIDSHNEIKEALEKAEEALNKEVCESIIL